MWAPVFSLASLGVFGVALIASTTGSLHCLGMCGPLRFIAGHSFRASAEYQAGRLFAYLSLGLFAGLFGTFLSPLFLICLIALTFIAFILKIALPFAMHTLRGKIVSRLARNPFLLGLGTGILPCGLLYGWIAAAVATRSPWDGSLLLFCLWLGTVPVLEAGTSVLRKPFEQLRKRFPKALPISFLLLAFLPIGIRLSATMVPSEYGHKKTTTYPYCHGSRDPLFPDDLPKTP
ncbi:MAG: sulfite exporter TauE/SafE family protein [Bacteriovoracia bacterium]